MLRSATAQSRLYLTAELRAVESLPLQGYQLAPGTLFQTEMKRFPPVDDVVAVLDRIASQAFAA